MSIPKTGNAGSFVDFTVNPNDTGLGDETAIQPSTDGETLRATAVTDILRRPHDNLRQRTEAVRGILDDNFYLRDADRGFFAISLGTATWASGTGIFTISDNLWLLPALTVGNSLNTPPVGSPLGVASILRADNTPVINLISALASYAGGDRLNVTVQGGGALSVVQVGGFDPDVFSILITIVAGVTTRLQLMTALTAAALPGFTFAAIGGADADIIKTTQPKQYFAGNWDSEVHVVTPANLATFMAVGGNPLTEGASLCIRYDMLIQAAGTGGRRQSTIENGNSVVPAAALFNSCVHPEYLPNSIPICKRLNGQLHFTRGMSLADGQTATLQGPTPHASTHSFNSSDPISYAALTGLVCPSFEMYTIGDTSIDLPPFSAIVNGRLRYQTVLVHLTSGGVLAGLGNTTQYYLYVYDSAGTLTYEASTTVPDSTLTMKSGDVTRTFLGAFRTRTSGKIDSFVRKGRTTTYIVNDQSASAADPGYSDLQNLTASTALTALTFGKFPPHVHVGKIQLSLESGSVGDSCIIREAAGAPQPYERKFTQQVAATPTIYHDVPVILAASAIQAVLSSAVSGVNAKFFATSYTD